MINQLNEDKFKFSIIAVTELWSVPPNNDFSLSGYSPLQYKVRKKSNSVNSKGGGVGIWVNEQFKFEVLEHISIFEPHVFESIFIKVYTSKNNYNIIGNIYRPNTAPRANIKKFNNILSDILLKTSSA